MNLSFSEEDLKFQQEVKSFIKENYPADIKEKMDKGIPTTKEDIVTWQKILSKKGWFAVNWPEEHGGTGWSVTQKFIFQNELAEANTPNIVPFGVSMCGPVIYTFGSDEQKERFLPAIRDNDVWWCQGYSEPGSGSDLASLKTKAEKEGDKYIVNGSKTWTTLAQNADWIFCLVRTDSSGIKQQGISFLLIDMKTPGVEVQPIITIDGSHEVNSVFFDNVEVPAENLIGE
jgi:alkylation response protein AidB-like acyl-CoA dehydrogenase